MKVTLNILLVLGCCSTLVFSKGVDNSAKKTVKTGSLIMMSTMKYSQGYGEFTGSDESIVERKRSHKRRKAVRKPRRGRGQ